VKGIAEAGMGAAEFITSGERMQAKVTLAKNYRKIEGLTFIKVRASAFRPLLATFLFLKNSCPFFKLYFSK
jgi:hypothetical protein